MDEGNDRLEESCSCDLNSIDNTESDGSPSIVKSRSETLETPQSSEVISLDSRLSDKPDTPTTALENHAETPTILEEANSDAISLPTTHETSEVISIESSSELYSEVQKAASSSLESVVHEAPKRDEQESEPITVEHVNNVVVTVIEPPPVSITTSAETPISNGDEAMQTKSEDNHVEANANEKIVIESKNTEIPHTETSESKKEIIVNEIPKQNGNAEEVTQNEIESEVPSENEPKEKTSPEVEEIKKELIEKIENEETNATNEIPKNDQQGANESEESEKPSEVKSEEQPETMKEPDSEVVTVVIPSTPEPEPVGVITESKTQSENGPIVEEPPSEASSEEPKSVPEEIKSETTVVEETSKTAEVPVTDETDVKVTIIDNETVVKIEKEPEEAKLPVENDREIINSAISEEYLTPTENKECSTAGKKPVVTETEEEYPVEESSIGAKEKDTEILEDKSVGAKTDENEENCDNDDKTDENVKSLNCSTSVVESSDACRVANEGEIEIDDSRNVDDNDKAELLENNGLSEVECAVDSLTEDKSAVINDNGEKMINEKHSGEPSNISTSDISDSNATNDVSVRTDEVDVITDSVCNISNVQSSVDNATQVPNPKHQIPTISTVCDATKSLPDGVPEIVCSNVIARDNPLTSDITPDHVDAHRRSSLPNVTSDNVTDNSGNEPRSLPMPLRKTSSPQKRPRSASTSTQVDPNHFGMFVMF